MKTLVFIFLIVLCCNASDSLADSITSIINKKGENFIINCLADRVKLDLDTIDEFEWTYQSLRTFPIKTGDTFNIPGCDEDKNYKTIVGFNNIIYLFDNKTAIIGIKYRYASFNDDEPYIYTTLKYEIKTVLSQWPMWKFVKCYYTVTSKNQIMGIQ